ncbi:hypothetical protein L2E82_31107 [Cichorium intybus]|uniref:Uncharacterized protein n=1 Tax=Cichorium intybus TaxID=13427 RepID=A0ACB9D2W2_CICIN|nr:hypothetical protein L2E82_31107 [Cichorium intybus]
MPSFLLKRHSGLTYPASNNYNINNSFSETLFPYGQWLLTADSSCEARKTFLALICLPGCCPDPDTRTLRRSCSSSRSTISYAHSPSPGGRPLA